MRIPSYDDLTPSIPDVSPADVFESAERLLPSSGPVARRSPGAAPRTAHDPAGSGAPAASAIVPLFAALHARDAAPLVAIAREFSPRLQRHGPSDVVADVAGLGRLLGDARAIGAELANAGRAACHVAVARTQIAARLLARARPGLTVADGDLEGPLGGVPLAILQQLLADDRGVAAGAKAAARSAAWPPWPSCERTFDALRRWGLTTLGEFAALPSGDLAARVGQAGLAVQRLARGIDAGPLVPDPDVPRFVESIELEWPIDTLEPLSFVFARLLEPLSAALERADRGAAALRLDLRLTDRSTHSRLLQLPAAMRDSRVLRTLLLLDLESHPPAAAVDIVSIEVDPAPARIVQFSLLERALPSAETLATLNARLGALVGDTRCGSPVRLDTHRPDGFVMRRFEGRFEGSRVRGFEGSRVRGFGGSVVRGFDGSYAAPPLRRFRPPVAIRVTVTGGRPARVAIDRQGMPGGRVEQAAGPWRSSGAWWEAARWTRDEWDVAFSDGTLCRIFRDRESGRWFIDGVFD